MRHVVLGERHLHEVLGHGVLEHIHVPGLGEAPEEVERQRPEMKSVTHYVGH